MNHVEHKDTMECPATEARSDQPIADLVVSHADWFVEGNRNIDRNIVHFLIAIMAGCV